jgi:hypothetical protein
MRIDVNRDPAKFKQQITDGDTMDAPALGFSGVCGRGGLRRPA